MHDHDKTYSGEQSYHAMLHRAQSVSPAIFYEFCKLVLAVRMDKKTVRQRTPEIDSSTNIGSDILASLFQSSPQSCDCAMRRFLQTAFGSELVAEVSSRAHDNRIKHLSFETQFVEYVQAGRVELDEKKRLVTIKP